MAISARRDCGQMRVGSMPQKLFRLQQDPSLVRQLARQFADKHGYELRQKPESYHAFAIECRDFVDLLDIDDAEKYHYQRDPQDQDMVILSVYVELTLPRQSQGTAVQLMFRDSWHEASIADELQSYLLNLGDVPLNEMGACPKCAAEVRAAMARYCGKCGESLISSVSRKTTAVGGHC